jgi:Domain of unknown function (DUF6916)
MIDRYEPRTGYSLTRRVLLKTGAAAAISAALPATAVARNRRRLLSHLARRSYRPLVGHRFRVKGTGTVLRLVAVEDLNHAQRGSQRAFALIFHAPEGAPPLAAVPTLHHAALGDFMLLLSPGRPSGSAQPYAAIINRVHA